MPTSVIVAFLPTATAIAAAAAPTTTTPPTTPTTTTTTTTPTTLTTPMIPTYSSIYSYSKTNKTTNKATYHSHVPTLPHSLTCRRHAGIGSWQPASSVSWRWTGSISGATDGKPNSSSATTVAPSGDRAKPRERGLSQDAQRGGVWLSAFALPS